MKKLLVVLAAAAMLLGCNPPREKVLKVYNWSNYIGEGVIDDFEEWYKEKTGEEIHVVYQTFDINETMLAKIEKGHEDYDVVCPSDYIIERMLDGDMLLPLKFSELPDSVNYIQNNRSPFMKDLLSKLRGKGDANDYSVPFMWGTTGLLYNARYITPEQASTWEILRDSTINGRLLMKDAPRDVFSPILMHLRQEDLTSGRITLDSLMWDSSDKAIAEVEAFMDDVKPYIMGWEADFGKEQMTQEKGWLSFNWSGDAVWAIEEAPEGVDLRYTVPKEGSSVWFDGWVIPKYAQNVKAATWFIDFMCRPDIAIRNMEETGYVSANGHISVLESQMDSTLSPVDVSYFFEGADSVNVDPVLYPDRSTIEHCALMHDWGKDTDKLTAMWSRVKGSNADHTTIIVISVVVLALAGFAVYRKTSGKARRRSRR